MSLKIHDLSRKQVDELTIEHEMYPVFIGQNPYIASGPHYEILASLMPHGLYHVELLDKKQLEESLQLSIKAINEYTGSVKS